MAYTTVDLLRIAKKSTLKASYIYDKFNTLSFFNLFAPSEVQLWIEQDDASGWRNNAKWRSIDEFYIIITSRQNQKASSDELLANYWKRYDRKILNAGKILALP